MGSLDEHLFLFLYKLQFLTLAPTALGNRDGCAGARLHRGSKMAVLVINSPPLQGNKVVSCSGNGSAFSSTTQIFYNPLQKFLFCNTVFRRRSKVAVLVIVGFEAKPLWG